jgi:hypothetical protein
MKSSDSDRWRLVALMASIFFMVDGHFFKTAGSPSTAGHQPKINHDRSHYLPRTFPHHVVLLFTERQKNVISTELDKSQRF